MSLLQLNKKPQALGFVKVTTPGTPVSLVSQLVTSGVLPAGTDILTSGGDTLDVNKIALWAPPNVAPAGWTGPVNAQTVYIGQKNMNKTTLFGVIASLSPGGSWTITNNVGSNVYAVQDLFVDADTANDGVYGNIDQA
jgi:hypothetical protein